MSEGQGLTEFITVLPVQERVPVVALYKLLGQRQAIDNEQEESITKIKLTFHEKLKPLLQRASEIIRGGALRQQQVANASEYLKPNENIKNYMKGKVIDNYWNSVLSNSPLVDEITEQDEKALSYLLDIQNVFPQNANENQNITLKFVFKENPFFNETQIIRNLVVKDRQMLALEGGKVTWKDYKWLTHEKKKITNKKTGETRIEKGKKIKSFFDIFEDWTAQQQQQLTRAGNFMIELANLIVMDSLDYFLGLINVDQRSMDDEEDDQDDEDEEMEGTKKVKQ